MTAQKDQRGAQASDIPRPLRGTQGPEAMEDARQSSLDSPWKHTPLVIPALQNSAIHPILREHRPLRDMEREEEEEATCGVPQLCVHQCSHTWALRIRHLEKVTSR